MNEVETKREFSTDQRDKLAKEGAAMENGSFPIVTRQDLMNAIHAFGRANPSDRAKVKAHIVKRAKALGATDLLPADWPGSTKEGKSVDTVLIFGGAVKTLGNGRVGGYLVQYGDSLKTDLTGDYFTSDTDFDVEFPGHTAVYYNHALDENLKSRKLGKGELNPDEVGVWVEAQLQLRDDYEKMIYKMADEGKLGWSSGTAAHLVERRPAGKAQEIVRWPLGLDASLTPTPAEPRNAAISLKSWLATQVYEHGPETVLSDSPFTNARDFERFLRDSGCPKSLAIHIASGFKAALRRESEDGRRDSDNEPVHDRVLAHVRALETRLRTGDFHHEPHASVQGAGTQKRP